jgi:lysophospholipase L1-like esterase
MPLSQHIRSRLVAACVALVVVAGAGALAPAAGASTVGTTYLALGDSLAYGFHQAQFEAEYPYIWPASFDDGYVNDFYARLRYVNPYLRLINDGCPGEGTETMIHGSGVKEYCGGEDASPWPYVWLHHRYATSTQLSDALAILHANRYVSPITLDIGANDVIKFLSAQCGFPTTDSCTEEQFKAEFTHIAENVGYILGQLRGAAPKAQMILVGLYNAYPGYPSPGGDRLIAGLNQALEQVAASVPGTSFANPEPQFNPSIVTGGPETEDYPTICKYTAMCPKGTFEPTNPKADIHPTDRGYEVIASDVNHQFLAH